MWRKAFIDINYFNKIHYENKAKIIYIYIFFLSKDYIQSCQVTSFSKHCKDNNKYYNMKIYLKSFKIITECVKYVKNFSIPD